mmetsp:Transcript_4237/g.7323  ORF Transcript_4237/g.7323 Transcript_4237/m.7323 type:complete len:237 (-) Transcript_4237:1061-1771(-)
MPSTSLHSHIRHIDAVALQGKSTTGNGGQHIIQGTNTIQDAVMEGTSALTTAATTTRCALRTEDAIRTDELAIAKQTKVTSPVMFPFNLNHDSDGFRFYSPLDDCLEHRKASKAKCRCTARGGDVSRYIRLDESIILVAENRSIKPITKCGVVGVITRRIPRLVTSVQLGRLRPGVNDGGTERIVGHNNPVVSLSVQRLPRHELTLNVSMMQPKNGIKNGLVRGHCAVVLHVVDAV